MPDANGTNDITNDDTTRVRRPGRFARGSDLAVKTVTRPIGLGYGDIDFLILRVAAKQARVDRVKNRRRSLDGFLPHNVSSRRTPNT